VISIGEKVGKLFYLPVKVEKGYNPRVFLSSKKDLSLEYL
jgi:hypothetical protein